MKRSVYICEDHPLFRQSLEALIEKSDGFEVIGSCGDGVTAIEALSETTPNLVLLDLNLPQKDGFQILEFIRQNRPDTCVAILTSYKDNVLADKARKEGACAYLLKDTDGAELVDVLHSLTRGEFYSNISTVDRLTIESDEKFKAILKLTKTEKKLVTALLEGASVQDLAERFHISENTVKNHKKNIYRKLQVSTQAELILLCQKHGLLD